jgi:hypothetical protein
MTLLFETGVQLCTENVSDVEVNDYIVKEIILIQTKIVCRGN